jgi:serine/threonine protein phosphatase 1
MRTLVIGDVHGCYTALQKLLEVVEVRSDDQLITLGDYVDRGPQSSDVLALLSALHSFGRLVPLRGNHEVMMLQARDGRDPMWLACGGVETLASYGVSEREIDDWLDGCRRFGDPSVSPLEQVPADHWKFIEEGCLPWYETDSHFFVHANAHPDVPLSEQPDYMLYWEKLTGPCNHFSGKIMVCGHTPQRNGLPLNLGTTVCIDTGVYEDYGWLTCLDVRSGKIWQANQFGKARTGWLEEAE